MRSQIVRKLVVWIVILTFFFAGATPAFSGLRIMPSGSVEVYKGEKLVQVLKQEAALPEGALLKTEGKCGVRSDNFYLVADDGSTFSIVDGADQMDLRVDNGVVYFAITEKTKKIIFNTPSGIISTQQILSAADADGGIVKGYLDVSGTQAQLGVLEGGSMVIKMANGDHEIQAGKQMTLSMAEPAEKEPTEKEPTEKEPTEKIVEEEPAGKKKPAAFAFGDIPKAYIIGGAVLLGAGILLLAGGGDDGPGPASPAAP